MPNASTSESLSPQLLKVVERAQREPEGRFHSLAHLIDVPALKRAPRKARALLRLERACAVSPALGEAWRTGRTTWSQALTLVPLALAPGSESFHAAWIERASGVTVRRLEDDVEHALASGSFAPALLPELPEGVQIGAEPMGGQETDVWSRTCPPTSVGSSAPASARWRAASARPAPRSKPCSTTA